MRKNIQLHDTFILFLCGATTMIPSSLSSERNDGGTRKHKRKRKRRIQPERSLQILDGHPGIMELIGDHVGLIRGKEMRLLKEFNEAVIKYNNTNQFCSSDNDEEQNSDSNSSYDDDDNNND